MLNVTDDASLAINSLDRESCEKMRTRFPIRTALPPVRLGCVISLFLVSVVPYGDAGSSSVGAVQIAGLNVHIVTSKEQGQCKTDCEMTPFLQGYMDLPDSQVMLFDITDGAQLASEMTEKYKSIADEAVRHGIADKTFIITSYDDLDLGNGDGRSKVTTALKNAVDQGVRLLGLRNTLPNVSVKATADARLGLWTTWQQVERFLDSTLVQSCLRTSRTMWQFWAMVNALVALVAPCRLHSTTA